MLWHSPPLPLIVKFNFGPIASSSHRENILLALQHNDRVSSIIAGKWCQRDGQMFNALNNTFPRLESLFIHSDAHTTQELPNYFVTPHLLSLRLHNIAISAVLILLTNATNLISLRLENIRPRGYFSPGYLVELLSSMPRLENLSIVFHPLGFSPNVEWESQHINRVVLPNLCTFLFTGVCIYLESLLALVSIPLLQYFYVTFRWQRTLTLPHLSEFLGLFQNLDFRTAEISLHLTFIAISYYPIQPSITLPNFRFTVCEVFDPSDQMASIVQICDAIAPVLPIVEGLVVKFDKVKEDFAMGLAQWHGFLRSFGGVRMLQTDIALAPELSEVLDVNNGAELKALLPKLSKIVVVSKNDLVHQPFVSLIHARRRTGHRIRLQVIKQCPPSLSHYHICPSF